MVVGWEALIVLNDVRGLPPDDQLEVSLWAARALIRAALSEADDDSSGAPVASPAP